jgi:hypothetical protein
VLQTASRSITNILSVVLGGVVVIVLAIEPKARTFKPGRERCIFKGDKIPYHDFRRPRVVIFYDMLKKPWRMINTLIGKSQRPFLTQFLPALLLDVCCNQSG